MKTDWSRPVLAVDTSSAFLSLALRCADQLQRVHREVGNRHSAEILPAIGAMLDEAGVAVADLGALVYAQGPGSFTGLRIGAGIVQGLATPYGIPLIGVPTLDALAALCPAQPCVLAATDARMGEVFYAWFDTVANRRLSPYAVGRAQDIRPPEGWVAADVCGVGNAFALAEPPPFAGQNAMPEAADYLNLAQNLDFPCTNQVDLLYVRDKVALTAAEQAQRKGQSA